MEWFLAYAVITAFIAAFALIFAFAHKVMQLEDEIHRKPWVADMDPKMVGYPLEPGASLDFKSGKITNDSDKKVFLSWKGH